MEVNTDRIAKLAVAWKRQLVLYDVGPPDVYAVYADDALTGWAGIIPKPQIGEFRNDKCILVPLPAWIILKTLGAETVTPFRLVAFGKDIVVAAWRPHTGLKYAVRNVAEGPVMIHIPVSEFKPL